MSQETLAVLIKGIRSEAQQHTDQAWAALVAELDDKQIRKAIGRAWSVKGAVAKLEAAAEAPAEPQTPEVDVEAAMADVLADNPELDPAEVEDAIVAPLAPKSGRRGRKAS